MEENVNEVVETSVLIDASQYEALVGAIEENSQVVSRVNDSVVHATSFLILLCIFQFYGLLSRSRKKAGVK